MKIRRFSVKPENMINGMFEMLKALIKDERAFHHSEVKVKMFATAWEQIRLGLAASLFIAWLVMHYNYFSHDDVWMIIIFHGALLLSCLTLVSIISKMVNYIILQTVVNSFKKFMVTTKNDDNIKCEVITNGQDFSVYIFHNRKISSDDKTPSDS